MTRETAATPIRTLLPAALVGLALGAMGCAGAAAEGGAASSAPGPAGYPRPAQLVPLLAANNPRLPQTAALLARTGSEADKRAATARLVALADAIGSDRWREAQRPLLARLGPDTIHTPGASARWLDDWQKRHLVRLYDALETLGGEPALEHCRAVARDESRRPAERRLALGVLTALGHAGRGAPSPWTVPQQEALAQAAPLSVPAPRWGGAPSGPDTGWALPQADRSPRRADAPTVTGGQIIDVDRVVDALRPYFKRCYLRALTEHGRFGAWIILTADVGSRGHVTSVGGSGDESTPFSMMSCLKGVVVQAQFTPPVGGRALVSIPLAFTAAPGALGSERG